jgi:DNA repair exonuclease SbcCD ATPase subunit
VKESKKKELESKNVELTQGLKELEDAIAASRKELEVLSKQMEETAAIRDKAQSCYARMESLGDRIKKLESRKNSSQETIDVEAENKSLSTLWSEKSTVEAERTELVDNRAYNEVLGELLKDSGIKAKITQQYIPVINTLVNKYLQILDFFVLFYLDENFNETIKSRHRDEFSYASFSEGEKQRIDLALLFTWRQIAKMKNSTATNLLILDETMDASMDSNGVDAMLKIIDSMGSDTNVFVISHKTDIMEGKFASKLEFNKVNNFSRMSIYN